MFWIRKNKTFIHFQPWRLASWTHTWKHTCLVRKAVSLQVLITPSLHACHSTTSNQLFYSVILSFKDKCSNICWFKIQLDHYLSILAPPGNLCITLIDYNICNGGNNIYLYANKVSWWYTVHETVQRKEDKRTIKRNVD